MPDEFKQPRRAHSRATGPALDPAISVFINCPFDPDYVPLFEAIVFACVSCGFVPRSSLESGTTSQPRLERIVAAIFTSDYSIRDLSRCRGEGDEKLARFNMPLELGMAMARRYSTSHKKKTRHDWLVLVPQQHSYIKYISDLAGFDAKPHDGTQKGVVENVVSWLATRGNPTFTPTNPKQVMKCLPRFHAKMKNLKGRWGQEVPWADMIQAARQVVPAP